MLRPVRSAITRTRITSKCSPIASKKPTSKASFPGSAKIGLFVPQNNPKDVKRRLFHVEETIRKRGTQRALAHAQQFLSQAHRVPTRIRGEFMKECVALFLNEGDWDAAYSIYWRMRGEQLPERSEALSRLLATSMKLPSTRKKVDQAIRDITNTLERVDEAEVCAILAHFIRSKAGIFFSRHLITGFQEKKGPQWTPGWKMNALLAQAESQEGYDHAAEVSFKKSRTGIRIAKQQEQLDWEQFHDYNQELYTHLFAGYDAFNRARPRLFNNLLLRMKRDGISPSQRICNIVIGLQMIKRRGQTAFTFYRAMRLSYPPISPNSITFRLLFSALVSKESAGWVIKYDGRRLFRHMTEQHLYNTSVHGSSTNLPYTQTTNDLKAVDSEVLNTALHLFMRRQDYAAATVTMRTFPICSIPPNENTREIVIQRLMERIKKELLGSPSTDVITWSDRMLGQVVRLWDGAWRSDVRQILVRAVHSFSRSMHGDIDIRMLLALLRRALVCSADLWPGSDPVKENALVSKEVAKAHVHMLPKHYDVTRWYTSPNYL